MTYVTVYTLRFNLQLCYKPLGILQRVAQSQKAHISSHDVLQIFFNINFSYHSSKGFQVNFSFQVNLEVCLKEFCK